MKERLRIIAKRVDHLERAFRKEERLLRGPDYEEQQKSDREALVIYQKARQEAAWRDHQENMMAKSRLARMKGDYEARKEVLTAKKVAEFAKRKEVALKQMEDEKAERRTTILKAREEERLRFKRAERARRKKERRIAAGKYIPCHLYRIRSFYYFYFLFSFNRTSSRGRATPCGRSSIGR